MVKLRSEGLLTDRSLLLEKESTAAGFLGVDIKTLETDADGRTT